MTADGMLHLFYIAFGVRFGWMLRSAMRDPQQLPYVVVETTPLTALEREIVDAVIREYRRDGSDALPYDIWDRVEDVIQERERHAANEGRN